MGGWSSSAGDAITELPVTVEQGGTETTTLTDGGILLGSGTGAITPMGVLADGSIVIGDGTTDPTTLAAFSSSTGTLNVASGGTGAATLTDGGILLGSGTGAITPMAVLANGSIVVGDGTTDPVALAAFTSSTGDLTLAAGGTEASLTASNGGIFYSTATAGAILAGTATALQMLQSGATAAPTWSTATYPATTTVSQILYSSATNVVGGITTANNGALYTDSTGIPRVEAAPNANGWFRNLSIITATTTNANDSITIAGAGGGALNTTTNSAWVDLPGTTAGTTTRFAVTANVTILLTGAHWENGTRGDLTGALLRVLAINDNGTLRWGVALLGGRYTILTTDTTATQTSVTLAESVLTTAAVASASNTCREIGFVRSNFDDTGGAAEDLWANQTGVGDIVTGQTADGLAQPWNVAYTGFSANPAATTRWSQIGRNIFLNINTTSAGTSSTTALTMTGPADAVQVEEFIGFGADNSSNLNDPVRGRSAAASSTLTWVTNHAGTAWTAAGTKNISGHFTYEVGPAASFIE